MGFFDRFKRKDSHSNKVSDKQLSSNIQYSMTSDGRLQIDFYDENADFKQFYDTTRLIINTKPLIMADHEIYNCIVSWYGKNDAIMPGGRREEYRGVLAELDLGLINDHNYCSALMKLLLEKKRVERYLEDGLKETPEVPCGKYIGGVMRSEENEYEKFFSTPVGEASHNSDLMVNRRKEYRENLEIKRQQDIAKKQQEIIRLQQEVDQMGRE